MRFEQLPVRALSARIRRIDGESFDRYFAGASYYRTLSRVVPSVHPDVFDLAFDDAIISFSPVEESQASRINRELGSGGTTLVELSDPAADGSAMMTIAFFVGDILDFGDIDIGVDEVARGRAAGIDKSSKHDPEGWFRERFTIDIDGESHFLIIAGQAVQRFQDSEPIATESEVPTAKNSFCIRGEKIRFVATPRTLSDGVAIYVVTRLTDNFKGNEQEGALRLARGRLTFSDWTATGQIRSQAKAQLSVLNSDKSSYLARWDEYSNLEGEVFLEEIRAFGTLRYSGWRPLKGGIIEVTVDNVADSTRESLTRGDIELEWVESEPDYLRDLDLTYAEIEREWTRQLEADSVVNRREAEPFTWEKFLPQTNRLHLHGDALPTAMGILVLSTRGTRTQIDRRRTARWRIAESMSANPQIGLLIQENGEPTSLRSPQRIRPLTAFTRDKVFRNPPTPMQERAIDVALNTPDIALIQGPPGTGKTTVIAAILERLNEIAGNEGALEAGTVLLTGFQHDAVENMIDRMSLNGLPVPKFGRRPNRSEFQRETFERNLENWCSKVAAKLRDKNPQIAMFEEERELQDRYLQYLRMPSRKLALVLIAEIERLGVSILGEPLHTRAQKLTRTLGTRQVLETADLDLFPAVQRLRVRHESFRDDGPERAADALIDLESLLGEEESELLEKASLWNMNDGLPPFLDRLRDLKKRLLREVTAPPTFRVEKHNGEVLAIADSAIRVVRESGRSASDKKTVALMRFLAQLENNPHGMRDVVGNYSFAYSATVQQSVGSDIRKRKILSTEDHFEYEYVIVDEAARVAPPDLMISLAQGKKIILVGDHRQLPHIVDDAVERAMENDQEGPAEHDWVKKSMFEYLFSERLKKLEERDGIQRRVTLDKQFRMHPILGDFVSRTFYERVSRAERFDSALPEENFLHNLQGTGGRPALWLDVPLKYGRSKTEKTSHVRQAEVVAIADQLVSWYESAEGRALSFGVISFYKAQAEKIDQEVRARLKDAMDLDRLKIGTVDSFQGREFDVVLLSVVRTSDGGKQTGTDEPTRAARRKFGHLCLSNRLNVAMSRQKRLLVVVGDRALADDPLADEFIPGIKEFARIATTIDTTPNDGEI